jgi:ubiquitin-protein ligase E3 C
MGHDEELLGQWSRTMNSGLFRFFTPLVCANICAESLLRPCSGKDAESWSVLIRQAALLLLTSVAHHPMSVVCFFFSPENTSSLTLFRSQHAVSHLNVLNTLLDVQSANARLVLGYLLDRHFYSLVAQAINSVVSSRMISSPI